MTLALKLDGVLGTQTSRLLLSYYSGRSHGTVCTTTCRGTCKGRNYCRPRDPASWPNMAATPDDCERTAAVALPTAASPGFISGEVGISAALDAFSTVYELPLTRFKKGQTNKQTNIYTDMNDHYTSLYELRPREVISPIVVCSQFTVGLSFDGTTNYTLELPPFVRACDIGTFGVWCRYAQQLFTSIEIPVDLFVSMMCSTRL